jgi:serine protease
MLDRLKIPVCKKETKWISFTLVTKANMKNRMLGYRHFFYCILLVFASSNTLFAQKKALNATYKDNIILVKFKIEFGTGTTNIAQLEEIKKSIAPFQLLSIKKTYPGIDKPINPDHIDLSRIYTLTFSTITHDQLPNVIPLLLSTQFFEYVEVEYIKEQQAIFYPNDPEIPIYQQKYLSRMSAFAAWEIEKGNPNVVIGIIDTGTDPTHEDLVNAIAYNTGDPINGLDDDNDGYIDNYVGWDFGNNDNDPTIGASSNHGAKVSGIAGATVNNTLGGAGIGFNSKILPVKASADNSGGAITNGNDAIIYAANHGCKVINLSYGNTGGFSSVDQDVINYAAINKDVLVVAAAGNTDEEADYYPASYENVLSVIAMDTIFSASANKYIDTRANFHNWACCYKATYSRSVDIGAQGMGLLAIIPTNKYTLQDGSSAASPVVAGAAALVRSHYPNISALQAAELLRVTADIVDTFPENALYKEKMGKGRINIYKALTDTKSPSIRYKNLSAASQTSSYIFSGDTVLITADFFNYLRPTNNLTIDLSSASSNITTLVSSINMGIIDSLTSKSNVTKPLTFIINKTATNNETIELRIGYSDPLNDYTDYQYFTIYVNPAYTTLYNNQIQTTITSNGRVGYQDINSTIGVGLQSNGINVLYEGGLLIGQNANTVSDCVRGNPAGITNLDFKPLNNPAFVNPTKKYRETFSKFNDSSASNASPQGIECLQRSYTFNETNLETTVFLEYQIINTSNADIDSLYVGQFMDWDVQNYAKNRASFDYDSHLGYAYDITQNNLYVGISLLSNQELHYYAMDNSPIGGDNIDPNIGYTTAEKFTCLSSKTQRYVAGAGPTGNDISMTMAGRINHLKQGDTAVIAFALLTSNTTLLDLKLQAAAAIQKFIELHTGPIPLKDSINVCTNTTSDILISPSPGNTFNFYDTIPSKNSIPIHHGKTYLMQQVSSADTIYITNADSIYESSYAEFVVLEGKALIANFTYTAAFPNDASLFTNESSQYKSLLWNFGDSEISTEVNPSHIYTAPGKYIVTLKANDQGHCVDSIKKTITILSNPLSILSSNKASSISLFPIPVKEILTVQFYDPTTTIIDVVVYNAIGQIVIEQNQIPIQTNQIQLSVSFLESGLYFIQLKNIPTQLRFIKQ